MAKNFFFTIEVRKCEWAFSSWVQKVVTSLFDKMVAKNDLENHSWQMLGNAFARRRCLYRLQSKIVY